MSSTWVPVVDGASKDIRWRYDGFDCHLLRHDTLSHWCGYVDVTAYSPEFISSLDYLNVHGGVTYSAKKADERYWIGFDAAHYGDYVPGMSFPPLGGMGGVYRDCEYMREEAESACRQILERATTVVVDPKGVADILSDAEDMAGDWGDPEYWNDSEGWDD